MGYLDEIITENKLPTWDSYSIICEDYFTDQDNFKILAILTKNIEKCLLEYIENAFKYNSPDEKGDSEIEIFIGCKGNKYKEKAITIDIINKKKDDKLIPNIFTANQHSLIIMGGKVNTIKTNANFHRVRIILPTPNSSSYL